MFKKANITFFPLPFSEKLKQKVWSISGILLLPTLLLIDVINVRTGGHQNALFLLIKNTHLLIPLVLTYLFASFYRDLLKIFIPLYLSLMLLVSTCSLALNQLEHQQNLDTKFKEEMVNIVKDWMSGQESPLDDSTLTYSAEEYGPLAAFLNKFKQMMGVSKRENIALVRAFNEIDLDSVFTDEVLFNFFKINNKKKQLEKLSVLLDESERRLELAQSEFIKWMSISSDLDDAPRESFLAVHYKTAKDKELFRKESYKIQKNLTRAYINLLEFLSNSYGTYERGVTQNIIFANQSDSVIFNSHAQAIINAFKHEDTFVHQTQQRVIQMEKAVK